MDLAGIIFSRFPHDIENAEGDDDGDIDFYSGPLDAIDPLTREILEPVPAAFYVIREFRKE